MKKFLNSRQRTETENRKHWRHGFQDRCQSRISLLQSLRPHLRHLRSVTTQILNLQIHQYYDNDKCQGGRISLWRLIEHVK